MSTSVSEFAAHVRAAIRSALASHGVSIHRVGLQDRKFVHAEIENNSDEISVSVSQAKEWDQGGWEIHGDLSCVDPDALSSIGMEEIEPERHYAPANRSLCFSKIGAVILTALAKSPA